MKFDNAFLTKNGGLGMQFTKGKNITLSVYPDKQGKLHVTDEANKEEKVEALKKYHFLKQRYMPAKAI